MQRIILSTLLCGAVLSAPISTAQDSTPYKMGPFTPGMTVDEAVSASPDLSWTPLYYERTGEQNGARSQSSFTFAGLDWDVVTGSPFEYMIHDEVSSLDLRTQIAAPKKGQCKKAMAQSATQLETIFGPFGLHPDFGSKRSALYGDPHGDGFKIKPLTDRSYMRVYPKFMKAQNFSTFREPQDGEHFRIMLLAHDDRSYKSCELRLNIFIPYVFDEDKKQYIVPPALAARFPGRYQDKPKR